MRYRQLFEARRHYKKWAEPTLPTGTPEYWEDDLDAEGSQIVSLENFPKEVNGNVLLMDCRHLATLSGSLEKVNGTLNLNGCKKLKSLLGMPNGAYTLVLTNSGVASLEGAPNGRYEILADKTAIKSLEGSPSETYEFVVGNKLQSLVGCPSDVNGDLELYGTYTSLAGCSTSVEGNVVLKGNYSTLDGLDIECFGKIRFHSESYISMSNVHKHVKSVKSISNPYCKSHALGVLLIPGLYQVFLDGLDLNGAEDIINKYLKMGGGRKHIMDCQAELIEAGFDDLAQL